MAGAPVWVPGTPENASTRVPSSVPTRMAVSAAARDSSGVPAPPGCSTKIAPVKPSRLTPRLPHRPNWSVRLSAWGTGSASVRPTSERRSPGTVTKVVFSLVLVESAVVATAASLRRNYPDRFGRSAAHASSRRSRRQAASHPLSPVSPSSRAYSVAVHFTAARRPALAGGLSGRRLGWRAALAAHLPGVAGHPAGLAKGAA